MAKAKLGAVVSSVRGSLGGLVVLEGRGGTVVRAKPTYRRPTTAAQKQVEDRMRAASDVWSTLTAAEVAAWRTWGAQYGRTAQTAFVGLVTKMLQVNPTAEVPRVPPTRDFIPDAVTVSATPTAGGIVFTASGPNQPGSVTEILIQPLKTSDEARVKTTKPPDSSPSLPTT